MKVTICLRESLRTCFGFLCRLMLVVLLGFSTFVLGCGVPPPFFLIGERRNKGFFKEFERGKMYVYADDVSLFPDT